MRLVCRFDRRLPLEESSFASTVCGKGVCRLGEVGVCSAMGIGVPVDARNFFEALFFGS